MISLPPLHPILVNFTAALVPVSLASDLLGRVLRRGSLQAAGWWTLLYAAIITPFTALAGWLWLQSMADMDHPEMAIHRWLGTALAAVLVPLVVWRGWLYRRGSAPSISYLLACAVFVAGLVYQANLGGRMSFEPEESAEAGHTHATGTAQEQLHSPDTLPEAAHTHSHGTGQPDGHE
jgi:uncharacterized membrane protein